MSLTYSHKFMRVHIANYVEEFKTQKEAARSLKISPQYLGDILKGRRKISGKIAKKFGFEIIFYKP